MGYDEIDAENEEREQAAYDYFFELFLESEEHREELDRAIDDFLIDRQKSYYLEHASVAQSAIASLVKAKELFELGHFSASQVFAGAAIEVAFKDVFVRPVVYGLVHNEDAAEMVADLVDAIRQLERLKKLVVYVASEFAGINFFEVRVGQSNTSLWEDITGVREKRNDVLHKGVEATDETARHSIGVAEMLLKEVFPAVIGKLGLHLHEGMPICGNRECQSAS